MSDASTTQTLARYVAVTAPGGLALPQGLLNTRATGSGAADLLDDPQTAQQWLTAGLAEWGERTGSVPREITLTDRDVLAVRALRQRLRRFIAGEREGAELDVPITIVAEPDGRLRTQPTGSGIRWLESAVWGAVLMAQTLDTLRRLKLCRNEACGSAFYDRSKNNSGVWHDVHTCGNVANLRASRARRRAT
jgi:predicted RNA-binding Zn ribbon-like protein